MLVCAELESPNDNDARIALGAEYGFREFIYGRLGYRSGLAYEAFSYGFGINYLKLRFDYAFVPYSDIGNSHRFSFFYGLGCIAGPLVTGWVLEIYSLKYLFYPMAISSLLLVIITLIDNKK